MKRSETTSTSLKQKVSEKKQKGTGKHNEAQKDLALAAQRRSSSEPTLPLMLRPKASQKVCAEQIAEQIGVKRSQLDPVFYLTGALLVGVERLSKEEIIGSWTRKQVAIYLKNVFAPLFELLYEQDELPLVFSLLIGREPSQVTSTSQQQTNASPFLQEGHSRQNPPFKQEKETSYELVLSTNANIGLEGFPDDI